MAQMRDLTKTELKLFERFLKGYFEGLTCMTKKTVRNILGASEDDIRIAYQDNYPIWKRNKRYFTQFHNGYMAGFFRRCSSELPSEQLDPYKNSDIYQYLQSTWLHSYVYATETQTK